MQRIELLEPISSGRFATVYKAKYQALKQPVAIKILPKQRQDLSDFQNKSILQAEITYASLLCTGKCPYIVKSLDVYEDTQNVYNIMELCDSNLDADLRHHLIGIQDYSTHAHVIDHLTMAVDFIHGFNLIHGDIKPANILYDKHTQTYKLSDFGNVIHIGSCEKPKFITPAYSAPELSSLNSDITQKSDVWSIGMTGFALTHGLDAVMTMVKTPPISLRQDLPSDAVDILVHLLDPNPSTRPSIQEFRKKQQSKIEALKTKSI